MLRNKFNKISAKSEHWKLQNIARGKEKNKPEMLTNGETHHALGSKDSIVLRW